MSQDPCSILIIEDNLTIRDVLQMGLEMEGYSVRVASDGVDALSELQHPPLPNLILLDLLMPRMNGYEFLEHIKKDPTQELANIPVIVLSAVAKSEKVSRLPVQGVLPKPVDLDKLFEVIQQSCRRH